MRTFSCGAEEPLQPNEQLYSLDERTGSIGLARFADAHLYRYSFVPQFDSNSGAELLPVVARIASALGVLATWLVAFLKSPATSPLRARALVKRLAKQEWHTKEGSDVYLATKPIPLDGKQHMAPEDADPAISGWTIVLGQLPEDESLVDVPFRETLRMMALTHRFQPSPEFLSACCRARVAVAYVAKNSSERIGLVVVSPRALSLLIRSMQRDGLVADVLSGADANQVWRN